MNIGIIAVNKVNALKTAQVVKGLFHSQTILSSELSYENNRPFQFILHMIAHGIILLSILLTKIVQTERKAKFWSSNCRDMLA